MEDVSNPTSQPAVCSRCGKPLAPNATEGLCPACLLAAGYETLSQSIQDAPTLWGGDAPTAADGLRLVPGQLWGPYRIGRLLGRGGMGEVYEAEQTKTGRRLALKVLRSRLQSAEERERFLREGRTAASISHPHTVYIFGSEEINGTPVISMELSPGGTLKDRVVSKGPLAPAEAASAVLDILGGLDAAQAAGILHRDIKPSNCFLDDQGKVKVGDFGLSISTLARDVDADVAVSGFQGTPQFAAPEQLRGEPLDVRADIYAVGATLYYLLTGRPPFDASDLRELVNKVTTELPPSPRVFRREIPSGLASVILQCLAKIPADRPPSYAALANALRPYSSHDNVAAGLGLRFVAGIVDSVLISLVTAVASFPAGISLAQLGELQVVGLIPLVAYFLAEGFWAATPGKRMFGMRVVSVNGGKASWRQIFRRHLIFDLPALLLIVFVVVFGRARFAYLAADPVFSTVISLASLVLLGVLFLTARRDNGWAGIHDLASGTRLVMRRGSEEPHSPAALEIGRPSEENSASAQLHFGPFTVMSQASSFDDGNLYVGFDPALRRHVWIRTLPPETPMISAARRDASRTGRLHWLSGRRSPDENWDAFEAPDGRPFLTTRESVTWSTLRFWLLDLSNELQISIQEGSLPQLSLDRLWVRNDRRVVLLDFPSPGSSSDARNLEPTALLRAVAERSQSEDRNDPGSVPLSARSLFRSWSGSTPPTIGEARTSLARLTGLDRVPKWRRALTSILVAMPFLFLGLVALVVVPAISKLVTPEQSEMVSLLQQLIDRATAFEPRLDDPAYRAEVERYLAGRHGTSLRDATFWNSPFAPTSDIRALGADIAARHPVVTAEELSHATATISEQLARTHASREMDFGSVLFMLGFSSGPAIVVWCLISSLILPGGLGMRLAGLAVVTRDGREIRRWRSLLRALIGWVPMIVWIRLVFMANLTPGKLTWVWDWPGLSLAFIPLIAGAIRAIAHPNRGLHDHALRTWVIPR